MIKSMTGYGRGEAAFASRTVTVEIRSVNNRYFDCSIKLPRAFIFAEEAIKTRVQSSVSRGKVDVFITLNSTGSDQISVQVNQPIADSYYAALVQLRDCYRLQDDLSVALLSRFPDVLKADQVQDDLEEAANQICSVVDLALAEFTAMRQREGQRLAQDIRSRTETIGKLVSIIEERSPKTVEDYRNKLFQRMSEVLQNTQIEESRILTEAAIFAEKTAVDEETVRLRSHLSELTAMLDKGGATGRKLDFLIQEFNREANTIGSKCSDIELTRVVVDLKAEIEKIREQVQNIE